MRIADLLRDEATLIIAREIAQELVDQDPELSDNRHAILRAQVIKRYGEAFALGDVA